MKKVFITIVCLALALSCSLTAFAAGVDDGILRVTKKNGKTYLGTDLSSYLTEYTAADGSEDVFYRYERMDLNGDKATDICDLVKFGLQNEDINGDEMADSSDCAILRKALIADINEVAYFDNITVSSAVSFAMSEKQDDSFRVIFSYDGDTETLNNIVIDGVTYTVTERGILLKDDTNSSALVKENVGKNGVVGIVNTSMANNYTYNSVTGAVSFSALIDGAEKDDKLTAVGYVILNDGSVYYSEEVTTSFDDIKDSIDVIPVSLGEETAYVYLPEGTEIAPSAPAATYYSDFFTEETDVLSGGIMQKGAYVNFSEETSFEKLTVPAELYYTVEIGTQEELYYGPEVSLVKKQLSSASADAVNYIFVTDIHYKNYGTASMSKYEHDGPIDRQINRIVKFANENDAIDFIVVGGDITTGMYASAEGCMDATSAALEPLKNSKKPVLVLMGNHDDNSYGNIRTSTDESLIPTYIVSDKYWNDRILDVYTPNVVHNTEYAESKYYYYDLAAYQNKTSYSFNGEEVTINVNFSDSGKIMSYQHGHVHYEVMHYSEDIDLWQFASDSANVHQTLTEDVSRVYMTNSEAAFDIMSVSGESVQKMNVGAGATNKFYYS